MEMPREKFFDFTFYNWKFLQKLPDNQSTRVETLPKKEEEEEERFP